MTAPKFLGLLTQLLLLAALAQAQITLTTSPNPSTFGAPVTLTATVAPSNATGRVTFYDGVTVLGTKPLLAGTASLSTILLQAGTRKLTAYYSGDASNVASTGNFTQTVNAVAAVGFRAAGASSIGIRPTGMAVGDFNGDGKADLAIPGNAFNGGTAVSILLGNGDGTFQPPTIYPLGLFISSIAIADFNGDGNSDIAVSIDDSQGAGLVSMLLGNGDGTFRPGINLSTVRGPMTVADFNGDGKPDLVLVGSLASGAILLGKGDGTFRAPLTFQNASASFDNAIVVGDFNGDGKPDFAIGWAGSLQVDLGNGDGTFQPLSTFVNGFNSFAIGDFNGDGKPDLVCSQSVLLGNGDGTFKPPVGYPYAGPATVGDFNGDGITDLAIANLNSTNVILLQGKGDGTFSLVLSYTAPTIGTSFAMVAGDFNGDGRVDLARADGDILQGRVTTLLGVASGVSLTATAGAMQSALLRTQYSVPLQVTVVQNGSPVNSAIVTFTAPSAGASAVLSSATAVTNTAGIASVTATANDITGSYVVTATYQGLTASFSLVNTTVASITASGGTPQSALLGDFFRQPLEVTVKDSIGNLASGAVVTFTAPVSGATARFSSPAVTNNAGIASVVASANGIVGSYTVTASTGGLSATFSLTNTVIASVTATGGTPQSTVVGTYFQTPLEVTVKDLEGRPVSGAEVGWLAPTSGASVALTVFPLTNAFGVARATVTANNISGSYTVTAFAGTLSASFSLTNLPLGGGSSNLALGKSATQSSTLSGYATTGPAGAVDGNTNGNFFNGSVTHTNLDPNAWWQVDLGTSSTVNSIVIWNRTDCCANRLSDYWVFISDTPFSPADTPATLQNRAATFSNHQTVFPNPSTAISVNGVQGRYVRVQLSGTNNLSLAEVQVIGIPGNSTGSTATQTASQSSTLAGYATSGAASAIDGNTDGNFFDGSVTHTNFEPNAWWEDDLGASTTISSIMIWNRTDCCSDRLNDYWVFVSNTPFSPTDTPNTLQSRFGTWSSHQTTAPNPSTTIVVGMQGRYVRIQLTGTNNLSLAEVRVLGTPANPSSGSNLALGKPASQSSTLSGYATTGAGGAVDGNTDGNFFDGSVTHTNLDPNAWWQVDLGASSAIGSIVIWNRTDCCSARLNDYWVFVSDTPFSPTDTPATLQGRAGTFSSHQTAAPSPSATISVVTQGRYVRVQLTGANNLSLAEVQVIGQ